MLLGMMMPMRMGIPDRETGCRQRNRRRIPNDAAYPNRMATPDPD